MKHAGFWARLAATLIDTLLLTALMTPLLFFVDFGEVASTTALGPLQVLASWVTPSGPVDFLVSWVAPFVATMIFWRYRSATPGKMLIGAAIVDAGTLGSPTMLQLVIRYFAYIVSIVPLGLGFLWIAWDPRKQSFHDKLASTLVVYKASPASTGGV